jgi:hypothetical protein
VTSLEGPPRDARAPRAAELVSRALTLMRGTTMTDSFTPTESLTEHDSPGVPQFVDDGVGGDASRQLGRFVRSVAENDETDLNEVDVGGQFYSRENAPIGDFGHTDFVYGTDSPPLSEDPGIAWVSGDGGTRGLIPSDRDFVQGEFSLDVHPSRLILFEGGGASHLLLFELVTGGGSQGEFSIAVDSHRCSSILEFSVENHPNNSAALPGSSISHYESIVFPNSLFNEPDAIRQEFTIEGGPRAPFVCANNLKQIGLAIHALDAGECSVDICPKNSPPTSPESVNPRGYAGATSS